MGTRTTVQTELYFDSFAKLPQVFVLPFVFVASTAVVVVAVAVVEIRRKVFFFCTSTSVKSSHFVELLSIMKLLFEIRP